jgi:hypothetical protein
MCSEQRKRDFFTVREEDEGYKEKRTQFHLFKSCF